MKKIEIEIPEGKKAEWVDGVLTLVDEQPQDITERIKTFEDACEWCYKNGKEYLVSNYEEFAITYSASDIASADILAYLKLRIITCALNEGWEPTFNPCESRYSLRYDISQNNLECVEAACNSSFVWNTSAATLYFKSYKLTKYADTQFHDIYMDFCYKRKE